MMANIPVAKIDKYISQASNKNSHLWSLIPTA